MNTNENRQALNLAGGTETSTVGSGYVSTFQNSGSSTASQPPKFNPPAHTPAPQHARPTQTRQPIYTETGKRVGWVQGDCYYKSVTASLHFLRRPPAIAFAVCSLKDAEYFGARYAEVRDQESGKVYRAALSTIWQLGFPVNRGHGEQWALGLARWNRDAEPAQMQLALAV